MFHNTKTLRNETLKAEPVILTGFLDKLRARNSHLPYRLEHQKEYRVLKKLAAFVLWVSVTSHGFCQEAGSVIRADVGDAIRLAFHPQEVPKLATRHRLLPSDSDLKEGNASVVMLRIVFEQQAFIQNILPKMPELMELEYDDPRIINGFHYDSFYRQLARAAYMRDASWEYPLHEEPLAQILLPDLQTMRDYVGRGLHLHCGKLIATGKLEAARECVLVQLACARHLARTPILVNRLVGEWICELAIESIETMLRQPNCPNLYWALTLLPESIADNQRALQWESEMLVRSIPSLGKRFGMPPIGHEDWNGIAESFSNLMALQMGKPLSVLEGLALQAKLQAKARQVLAQRKLFDQQALDKMLPTELTMRWILMITKEVSSEVEAIFCLPPTVAIPRLTKVESECKKLVAELGAPASPFPTSIVGRYLAMHRFDRNIKQLQIVEAIRDHASKTGELPESLSKLEQFCPEDPLTGKPFEYRVSNTQAILSAPKIGGLENELHDEGKTYRLKIASGK